jgi:hypothetical protein
MVILQINQAKDMFQVSIMQVIMNWKNTVALNYSDELVSLAQTLCFVFAIIWCAAKLYPVIAGEDKLSVLPLLRPFFLSMAIAAFPLFVGLVNIPGKALEQHAYTRFYQSWEKMKGNAHKRYESLDKTTKKAMEMATLAERGENAERNQLMTSGDIGKEVSDGPFGLGRAVAGMTMVVMNKLKQLFYGTIQYLALVFMNVVVCGVLFGQAAAMMIMAIIGPLAFAFSCLDPWKQSWAQWTARFISVSLWSGLAYFVCFAAAEIMSGILLREISILEAMLQEEEWKFAILNSLFGSDQLTFPVLTLFVAFGMIVIFPVSTWIIQTTGAHSAIIQPVSAAVGVAAAGVSLAKGAAGGGAGK